MLIVAKQILQCDNCKQRLLPEENEDDVHMQAKLKDSKNKDQDFHFCSEECLRIYLNKRAKRAKSTATTIKFDPKNRSWEVDLKPSLTE